MTEPLGLRLKSIREFYGWSQRELAKRAGVPNSAISVIEQGSVSPSVSSLERVLSGFPISIADFFTICLNLPPDHCAAFPDTNPAPFLADLPLVTGRSFSLKYCKRRPDEASEHLLSSGQTLIMLIAGKATYHSLGVEEALVEGRSVSLSRPTLFRVQAVDDQAEWVIASLSRSATGL